MKKFSIIIILLSIGIISCKQSEQKTNTPTPMESVMAVHDSLMPKMSKISQLINQLDSKIDSTQNSLPYQNAQEDLQASHEAMMDWMQDFGNKFEAEEILKGKELSEEKKALLAQEKVEVEALKQQIESSISNAENLLAE